jgi:hypothetical protein
MQNNPWTPSKRERLPAVAMKPIVDSGCWYPDDLRGTDAWIYRLSENELGEILEAVDAVEASGLDLKDVTPADFPLPRFTAVLADIKEELMEGRGFAVIRGLPTAGRTRLQTAIALWGIATYMGRAVSQNAKGHLLGHVKNLGEDINSPTGRGYNSASPLGFHADSCDLLGLCCLHPAKSGGEHTICSSVAAYNVMLERRPDLVKELFYSFYRTRRGEVPAGQDPWTRQPVFSIQDGYFAARGASSTIERAQRLLDVPKLTPAQREAIAMYGEVAKELKMVINFELGDLYFVHNHVALHARTHYEDWPEPERKRHLFRLWLSTDGERPTHPEIVKDFQEGITVAGTVLHTPLEAA